MTDLNDRLDAAIDDLLAGKAPPQDEEIQELLAPGKLLMEAPVPAPAHRTARVRMNAALDAQRNRKRLMGIGWLAGLARPRPKQWMPVVALGALAVLLFFVSIALPGQFLYPIKQSAEALGFILARTPQAQANYYLKLADRRLTEMERLIATGRPVPESSLNRFQQAWERARAIPGVDESVLKEAAQDQIPRLKQLIPQLPLELQDRAQAILQQLIAAFQIDIPPEPTPIPHPPDSTATSTPARPESTPTPAMTSTIQPGIPPNPATDTPTPTDTTPAASTSPPPTHTPAAATATPTSTPTPSRETETPPPTHTPRPVATPTPTPTATHTPHPTATHTPTPTYTPTHTPSPTSTSTPKPTHTPTATDTPEPTETPEETETPEHDETKTPEPTETHEPTRTPPHTRTPHARSGFYLPLLLPGD